MKMHADLIICSCKYKVSLWQTYLGYLIGYDRMKAVLGVIKVLIQITKLHLFIVSFYAPDSPMSV